MCTPNALRCLVADLKKIFKQCLKAFTEVQIRVKKVCEKQTTSQRSSDLLSCELMLPSLVSEFCISCHIWTTSKPQEPTSHKVGPHQSGICKRQNAQTPLYVDTVSDNTVRRLANKFIYSVICKNVVHFAYQKHVLAFSALSKTTKCKQLGIILMTDSSST